MQRVGLAGVKCRSKLLLVCQGEGKLNWILLGYVLVMKQGSGCFQKPGLLVRVDPRALDVCLGHVAFDVECHGGHVVAPVLSIGALAGDLKICIFA